MTKSNDPNQPRRRPTVDRRVELVTHLRWVPLSEIRYPEEGKGQRHLAPGRVNKITGAGFNPDLMGYPVASHRDGHYWILDGHARIEGLKEWLGEWQDQHVQCRVYEGLTVEQEADVFLGLNDFTQVSSFAKFKNAVTAERPDQTDINRITLLNGLIITRDNRDQSISCVGALEAVYSHGGPVVFGQTVRVTRDAYGKPGFRSPIFRGLGLVCTRYNGQLQEADAITKLGAIRGGAAGLIGRAQMIRKSTDATLVESIAAAAVDIINVGTPNNKKLTPWFKGSVQRVRESKSP